MSEQKPEKDHLTRARDEAGRHHDPDQFSTAQSPDGRTVPSLLSGILDALIAIAERMPDTSQTAICPHGMTGLCMYCVRDFDLLGGRHG